MAKAQVRSAVGILALVAVGGGAIAFFVKQSHGQRDDQRSEPAKTSTGAPVPEEPTAVREPRAPVKLGSVGVPEACEYFASSGFRFEDKPPAGKVARVIGTSQDGHSELEFVGPATLAQATLRYTLQDSSLNGRDMAAIMYLMQHVEADEAEVRWGIDAARKGEPTTRTIGAVAYAIQRGPSGTNEFVMRPAPGFE